MKQCLKIVVTGRVQGVNYRSFVQKEAQKLEIEGTIQNSDDGTVVLNVCGKSEALDVLMDILYKGGEGASVENVSAEPLMHNKDFRGVFRIIG